MIHNTHVYYVTKYLGSVIKHDFQNSWYIYLWWYSRHLYYVKIYLTNVVKPDFDGAFKFSLQKLIT